MRKNKSSAKVIIYFLVCLSITAFAPDRSWGQFSADASNFYSSTTNLINDSSNAYDVYTSSTMKLNFYPLSSLSIGISGEHTYYRELTSLSNIMGRLAVNYIPIRPNSKWAVQISSSISGRIYHEAFSKVDNNIADISISADYQIKPSFNIRAGTIFRATDYINTDSDYKRDWDIFAGSYFSLPGKTALDIEIGLGRTNYTYKDAHLTGSFSPAINPNISIPYDRAWLKDIPDIKDNLRMLYLSPRLSKTLAAKTGISFTYTLRRFQNYNDGLLWDVSTGFLSPWANIWEGQNMSINLKTFLIPKIITTIGYAYYDKTFLVTSNKVKWNDNRFPTPGYEDRKYGEARVEDKARLDYQNRYNLNLQWPIKLQHGLLIEPTLYLEYVDNKSSKNLYRYNDLIISAGFSITL